MKIHGFPADINVETFDYKDPDSHWKGYESHFEVNGQKDVAVLYHSDRHSRVLWVDGFLKGLLFKDELPDWIQNYSGCQL